MVQKTPSFQCQGCGFDPWLGNSISQASGVQPKKNLKIKKKRDICFRRGNDREPVPKRRPESSSGSPSHGNPAAHSKDLTATAREAQGALQNPMAPVTGKKVRGWVCQTPPKFWSKHPPPPSSLLPDSPAPALVQVGALGGRRAMWSGSQDPARSLERTLTPATQGWTPIAA